MNEYVKILEILSGESKCRRKVAAIILQGNRMVCHAVNQVPDGIYNKCENGCLRDIKGIESGENQDICEAIHAEQNVIAKCAAQGIRTEGTTMYVTYSPCINCARLIIQAKIKKVIFLYNYNDCSGLVLLESSNVEVEKYSGNL